MMLGGKDLPTPTAGMLYIEAHPTYNLLHVMILVLER